jgi:hypothetical protein
MVASSVSLHDSRAGIASFPAIFLCCLKDLLQFTVVGISGTVSFMYFCLAFRASFGVACQTLRFSLGDTVSGDESPASGIVTVGSIRSLELDLLFLKIAHKLRLQVISDIF